MKEKSQRFSPKRNANMFYYNEWRHLEKLEKIQIYEIRNNLKKPILIAKTINRSNKKEEKDEIGRKTPGNDRIVLYSLDSVVVKPSSFAIRNLVEIL